MDEREEIPRTTQYERDRAQAVHSLDDETRLHADPDEPEVVQGADGDIRRPNAEDRGGDVLGGDPADDDLTDPEIFDADPAEDDLADLEILGGDPANDDLTDLDSLGDDAVGEGRERA